MAKAAPRSDDLVFQPAEPAGPAPVVSRITILAREELEAFDQPQAIAGGQVTLISLDGIVERLADRWQGRREAIYDLMRRRLEVRLGAQAQFTRVAETEYLVMQPDRDAVDGQCACLRVLTEVVRTFAGEAQPSDLRLRQVISLGAEQVSGIPIDPRTLQVGGKAREAAEKAARLAAFKAEAEADPTLLSPERWSPFIGANGRKVRVSCKLEPVFELTRNSRIGYRLNRRVIDMATDEALSEREVHQLSRADHLRIDMAAIARGLERLESSGDGDQALSLIIPVSYITLSHSEGQRKLAQAFARARQAVMKGVLCEVWDIEGVPASSLMQAISLIRPWSLFVIGHLTDEVPQATPAMKQAGMQAISFNCPTAAAGDAEFIGWLRQATASARKAARTQMVYGCTPKRMAMAGMLGATHASVGA